jgi:hypothetical protein
MTTNIEEFKQLTKKELINKCKELNIYRYSNKNKNELIELILGNDNIDDISNDNLDKFYTIKHVAEKCINKVGEIYNWNIWDLVIEPSAGNGSFLKQIPTNKCIGIDILPEDVDIKKQDFFTYIPPTNMNKILVIGNPPFGRVSSIAVKFFNHAAKWASVIAFIVPRTFRRISIQNRLNSSFHLLYDEEIPTTPCAFEPPMLAKCCFQIWEKKDSIRNIIILPSFHNDWEFIGFGPIDDNGQPTPPTNADFAIRAYGGKCGEIIQTNLISLRPKSWHWIKSNINKDILVERFSNIDYTISMDTARQNSIGRAELVKLYSDKYD